jgi:phosphohistidine phosphatase
MEFHLKTLMLMRHAKSDWSDSHLSDHDRPLNKRGRRAAPIMAQQMLLTGRVPEVILASSAVRVQETVALMLGEFGGDIAVLTEPELYLASVPAIASHVDTLHQSWECALVVGHNPGMGALVSQLAEESTDMPTAAVAVFQSHCEQWRSSIARGAWQLHEFWTPRALQAQGGDE